jgi:hypothetical protein
VRTVICGASDSRLSEFRGLKMYLMRVRSTSVCRRVLSARRVIILWRAAQVTQWLAVRGVSDVARAAHALVSRAGLAYLMRVRNTRRRALDTALGHIYCGALRSSPSGWLCAAN